VSRGIDAIRDRRAVLLQRAASDREALGAAFEPWRRPLAFVDRGVGLYTTLKQNAPLLGVGLSVAAAALAVVRPPGIAGWLRGGRAVLSLARRLAGR
jgi:hypothetical protein